LLKAIEIQTEQTEPSQVNENIEEIFMTQKPQESRSIRTTAH
jgi:hypothetical protein